MTEKLFDESFILDALLIEIDVALDMLANKASCIVDGGMLVLFAR